jgi:hypothetical protein
MVMNIKKFRDQSLCRSKLSTYIILKRALDHVVGGTYSVSHIIFLCCVYHKNETLVLLSNQKVNFQMAEAVFQTFYWHIFRHFISDAEVTHLLLCLAFKKAFVIRGIVLYEHHYVSQL